MMRNQRGFTFIEVLVSMVIFAVAFLGLNALQIQSFRDSNTAFLRSQATYLAYDLADRIRANVAMALEDADNDMTTPMTLPANNYSTLAIPAAAPAENCTTTACTAAQLANQDLYEVSQMAAKLLSDGQIAVTAAGSVYTITVSWYDPFAYQSDTSLSDGVGARQSVSLDVQP